MSAHLVRHHKARMTRREAIRWNAGLAVGIVFGALLAYLAMGGCR